ncbi:hypothetical protein ACJX0J_031233 [Zea mays]
MSIFMFQVQPSVYFHSIKVGRLYGWKKCPNAPITHICEKNYYALLWLKHKMKDTFNIVPKSVVRFGHYLTTLIIFMHYLINLEGINIDGNSNINKLKREIQPSYAVPDLCACGGLIWQVVLPSSFNYIVASSECCCEFFIYCCCLKILDNAYTGLVTIGFF